MQGITSRYKLPDVTISNLSTFTNAAILVAEGMALANYQFLTHVTNKKNAFKLSKITIDSKNISKQDTDELNTIVEATNLVRDLVNEPVNYLNAVQIADAFANAGKAAGFTTKIFDKKKKMVIKILVEEEQGQETFRLMT